MLTTSSRVKRTRLARLLAVLVAAALVASACGADSDDSVVDTPVVQTTDAMADEVLADEVLADDAMADEVLADEAMADDAMADDAMADDAMADDAMADDAMADEASEVTITIENIASFAVADSGSFAVPVGADGPGPVLPGGAYEFTIAATPGQRLSFATMFVQSNDWFFATRADGIELFDAAANPISADITDQIFLYDAGTELDQEPGAGADQAPRQSGPNTGDVDGDNTVRLIDRNAADYVSVTVTAAVDGQLTVRVENVSETASTPTPIAPGVFAVHSPDMSLFAVGDADRGEGLEALAEDGNPALLAETLNTLTGTATPLAPGAFATSAVGDVLFTLGDADRGDGLEALAEDGNPALLAETLASSADVRTSGVFAMPVGADGPGPLLPGESYSFTTTVSAGEMLLFATMFVQSNDWIFATPAAGLAVLGSNGEVLEGDISEQILLIDVGTETDQQPGAGADQAPRQGAPDTGAPDSDDSVRVIDRSASRYIKVSVTAG